MATFWVRCLVIYKNENCPNLNEIAKKAENFVKPFKKLQRLLEFPQTGVTSLESGRTDYDASFDRCYFLMFKYS